MESRSHLSQPGRLAGDMPAGPPNGHDCLGMELLATTKAWAFVVRPLLRDANGLRARSDGAVPWTWLAGISSPLL